MKGYQPPLLKPIKPGLVDKRFHEVLSIREAFVVSLLLISFKGGL